VDVGLDVSAVGSRAFAATWRDESGQVVATTWGGTMCWYPRLPGRLRIKHGDFEHIIRCGDCKGCIEFDRRRLADRLRARYQDHSATLWLIRIFEPLGRQSTLSHQLHRRPKLELEPGTFRLGPESFAILARSKKAISAALVRAGIKFNVSRILLSRKRRAWRSITGGLSISREVYGANTNRYYARGLPPAEKETWEVKRIAYQKGYNRASSPRAWIGNGRVLIPPEVMQWHRNNRRAFLEALRSATNPEQAAQVINLVSALNQKFERQFNLTAAPQARLTKEQKQAWYKREAERIAASELAGSALKIQPPLSEVGGYVSSVHTTSTETPKLLSDEELREVGPSGRERWMERELERERLAPQRKAEQRAKELAEIQEWLERNQAKAKKREEGG
jgi:hypothetical protein